MLRVLDSPGFWFRPPTLPARLLTPVARVYGAVTARRMDRAGAPPPCPLICVGNLTLGGAGKTPTALRLAGLLAELGARPAFLTRGYGGRLAGPVRVDPARHAAADVGDEPLLLARAAPTIVARDRPAGARLCVAAGADAVVMDDGLQNPSLRKTLSLAVVDAGAGAGNGLAFPAGPLRAPLARQWRHVHALVLIGEGAPGEAVARAACERGLPVHRARLVPDGSLPLAGRRVAAFAGIGRPEKFFATLRDTGADLVLARGFPDHHPYRAQEIADLRAGAERAGALLVTTEKDWMRLDAGQRPPAIALRVDLRFEDEAPLRTRLAGLIAGRSG